ncbi:DegV family protein, partial [Streptococcus pyogenes]
MKLAIITDSSAVINPEFIQTENLFVLDIPVTIDGQE